MAVRKTTHIEGDRLLRIKQVLEIVPIGKSTWWRGVKSGRFPEPVRLGPKTTCWRESEINALMEK
jgi:predicted DNA-binding transcriptional regulator AlpA